MKNIHVVKTGKPSRLHLGKSSLVLCDLNHDPDVIYAHHIYITSNEEIKDNDYITDGYLVWKWKDDSSLLGRKKIILTTDQDLIKDGVQAIDDEFLEWFVKNPDCEWVEVQDWMAYYKIFFPEQESKQETLEKAAESKYNYNLFGYEKYRYGFIEGAKWQQEKMYSEEEVIAFGWLCREKALTNVDLIFEQFRKK